MIFLDFVKQYYNFDIFLVLMYDAGYSNEEIMEKFQVSKQSIYNAQKRWGLIKKGLDTVDGKVNKSDPNINEIIETFQKYFGTTSASRYDRYAAKRLYLKHDTGKVVRLIQGLAAKSGEQYSPTVNNVSDIEKKLPQIVKFLQSQSTNTVIEDL